MKPIDDNPPDDNPLPNPGMGIKTRKMLTEFIESLAEEQQHRKPTSPIVKPSVLEEDEDDDSHYGDGGELVSKTDRRIRALWENLKNQLSEDADSKEQQPSAAPPPRKEEKISQIKPVEFGGTRETSGSLEQFSSPALGRRLGRNTKRQVKSIIHNLAKNWTPPPAKIIDLEEENGDSDPKPN